MSLSNTLDKLFQRLKQKDVVNGDVEDIVQRVLLEIGEVEATISELTDRIKILERRENSLEEQLLVLEERISELESLSPDMHDAS
jgi:chromosome segregation ATPase